MNELHEALKEAKIILDWYAFGEAVFISQETELACEAYNRNRTRKTEERLIKIAQLCIKFFMRHPCERNKDIDKKISTILQKIKLKEIV